MQRVCRAGVAYFAIIKSSAIAIAKGKVHLVNGNPKYLN